MVSLHQDIENELSQFLLERGFSEDVIVRDAAFSSNIGGAVARPDVVILEENTDAPIAIFEVKGKLSSSREHKYTSQVKSYSDLFPTVLTYLVTRGEDRRMLFHRFDRELNQLVAEDKESLPDSQTLSTIARESIKADVERKNIQRRILSDRFALMCYMLAAICSIIGLLDFFVESKEIINPSRLALLGVVVGLCILPYAQKLKLLGFEYERITMTRKKSDDERKRT